MVERPCSNCGEVYPLSQLKRCARCHLDLYCSKECQRAHWKNGHKESCIPRPNVDSLDPSSPERITRAIDDQIRDWISTWNLILWTFGLLCFDLPNQASNNHHLTHIPVICLTPRSGDVPNPAQCYKMKSGEVWTHERCVSSYPELTFEPVEKLEPNLARIVITVESDGADEGKEGAWRRSWLITCRLSRIERYLEVPEDYSWGIASCWVDVLSSIFDKGDVEEANRIWSICDTTDFHNAILNELKARKMVLKIIPSLGVYTTLSPSTISWHHPSLHTVIRIVPPPTQAANDSDPDSTINYINVSYFSQSILRYDVSAVMIINLVDSRECQRTAWMTGHKDLCSPYFKVDAIDPASPEWIEDSRDKQLGRWMATWSLILWTFALLSLDLPNQPDDHNLRHIVVLRVGFCRDSSSTAQSYKMKWGELWPQERCKSTFPALQFTPIEELEPNRAHVIITMEDEEGVLRRTWMMACRIIHIERYREIPKDYSRGIASCWADVLSSIIEKGNVKEANRVWCLSNTRQFHDAILSELTVRKMVYTFIPSLGLCWESSDPGLRFGDPGEFEHHTSVVLPS
ncbi:hypothetical protein BDN72DRAFT_878465 [Pluteus cervinus]|uniref:Uncharacterized protein n=1 Tax=Pluteus cervinus TaxID=181527 RepID=A0ACD3ATY9_9AGAR|nr:hypothetical protein BDN72DRAFT_878465 [Pluteus cervinus]